MWLIFRRFRCRSFCRRYFRVIIFMVTLAAIFSTMIFVTPNGNLNSGIIYPFKRQDRKLNEYLKRTSDERSLADNFDNSPESISDHGIQDHFLNQGNNLHAQIKDHQRIQTLQNQLDQQKQVQQQLEQRLRELHTYNKQRDSEKNNPHIIHNPISLSPIPKSENKGINSQQNNQQQNHQEQSKQQQLLQQQQQQRQQQQKQQQQQQLHQQQQQQKQQMQQQQQQQQQLQQQLLQKQQRQQHQQQQQQLQQQQQKQQQQQEQQRFQNGQQKHQDSQAPIHQDQETLQQQLLQQQREMMKQQEQWFQQKSLMQGQMQQQPHIQQQLPDAHIQQQQPVQQQVQNIQQPLQHQQDPRAQQPIQNVQFPNPQQHIQQNQQVQYFQQQQQQLAQNSIVQPLPYNQQQPVQPQLPQAPQPVQWQIMNNQGNYQNQFPNSNQQVLQDNSAPSKSSPLVNGFPVIVAEDIVWSKDTEAMIPVSYSWSEVDSWCSRVRTQPIVFMTPGDPFKCGVPPNQYAVLADGTQLCVRYRHPHTIMLHGEIYSFYLARLLDIKNVPQVVLSEVDKNGVNWQQQATNFDRIQWTEGKFVVLSQFVEDLEIEDARYPMILFGNNGPILASTADLVTLTASELTYLVQWTDLVVLDYLTGHIDRITNHQEGSYGQTDEITNYIYNRQSIHNLGFGRSSGILWFIDNESGFRTGYSTLYINRDIANMKKYNKFHEETLRTICIFRRTTVDKLTELYMNSDPWSHLKNFVDSYEPLAKDLKPVATHDFPVNFKQRVVNVYKWMQECRQKH